MAELTHMNTDDLVSAAAGRPIDPVSTAHLRGCDLCGAELAAWRSMATATRAWAGQSDVGPALAPDLSSVDLGPSALPEPTVTSPPPRRTARPRVLVPAIAAAAVAAAAVVGLAVGGGDGSDSALLREIGNPATPLTGTVHIELSTETGGDASTTVYYSEDLDAALGQHMFEDTFYGEGRSLHGLYGTIIRVGDTGYVRYATRPSVPLDGPGWYSFPNAFVAKPAPVPPGTPGHLPGVVGPIVRLGHSVIHGVPAAGYEVTVNVRRALAEATTQASRNYLQGVLNLGVNQYPARIWLDDQGRPVELRYWYLPGVARITVTEAISYSPQPFRVSPPPAVDVTPAADQNQAETLAAANPVGTP